ncbi:MAG: hypothetical protein HQK85_08600 [Nitrospinae bacterium]|nr:hypothetical protein [Nitrospinota bacterium]
MTEESKILLAMGMLVLAVVGAVGVAPPYGYEAVFFPHSPRPALGWAGAFFVLVTLAYSLRKRLFLQAPGALIFWKAAHVVAGYVLIILILFHSNGGAGAGAQFFLSLVSAGLLITGLWGIARQGHTPAIMTKALLDPVYKSEHRETDNLILAQIAAVVSGKSQAFGDIYQRHILPFVSISLPSLEHHKAILRRCFGPASADPNAAVTDLANLSPEERGVFYEAAEKAVDLVELRLSKTYQRGMNQWLQWHIWLSAIIVSVIFFHILASFYFGSRA